LYESESQAAVAIIQTNSGTGFDLPEIARCGLLKVEVAGFAAAISICVRMARILGHENVGILTKVGIAECWELKEGRVAVEEYLHAGIVSAVGPGSTGCVTPLTHLKTGYRYGSTPITIPLGTRRIQPVSVPASQLGVAQGAHDVPATEAALLFLYLTVFSGR
jgi:threonine dehydrogenase-like Zn-dependent dehydrogenase